MKKFSLGDHALDQTKVYRKSYFHFWFEYFCLASALYYLQRPILIAFEILQADSPDTADQVEKILAVMKKSDPSWTKKESKHPMVECVTFADDIKYKGGKCALWGFPYASTPIAFDNLLILSKWWLLSSSNNSLAQTSRFVVKKDSTRVVLFLYLLSQIQQTILSILKSLK